MSLSVSYLPPSKGLRKLNRKVGRRVRGWMVNRACLMSVGPSGEYVRRNNELPVVMPEHRLIADQPLRLLEQTLVKDDPVELHPLPERTGGRTRYDLRASIAPIIFQGPSYSYTDPGRWGDMMGHTNDAQAITSG